MHHSGILIPLVHAVYLSISLFHLSSLSIYPSIYIFLVLLYAPLWDINPFGAYERTNQEQVDRQMSKTDEMRRQIDKQHAPLWDINPVGACCLSIYLLASSLLLIYLSVYIYLSTYSSFFYMHHSGILIPLVHIKEPRIGRQIDEQQR